MKKNLSIVFFLMFGAFLFAQQITRFAVIDTSRIYTLFLRDSRAVRDYEAKKAKHQAEIKKMSDEIIMLRQKKVDAEAVGKENIAQKYDAMIASKTSFLVEYSKASNDELAAIRKNLTSDDEFYGKLYNAIKKIAESEGYTMVLDLQKDSGIVWYSPTVDITEQTIRELGSR
ncbi:OmpH family outer membrane protein [Treponema phagedenis]|uniref:Outer membrane protein n=1 Tax=Treponema phagedenis TaxID=162 RepID=A0A0B7GUJ8_TREPH|nr:OmpH family outer membrane protein [Treponema phagedenis]EFW37527.1 outer membrane protein [Treponema phagedenis F0421]NVP23366.1 OmpH family outer membrane protein [Treponema phagedenis]QEJ95588.1 OmpH family outer membrane protein [Treponema phagedenis]QEJ98510.1 OmpH family outer membrane protein [Treponema phagedenis]QEK01440.1 OmpH family outer membrane protein [Treponema phagedenis]